MSLNAFVYTELQAAIPFADAPWRAINAALREQPGLIDKTWLAGVGNNSIGGFYAFDSLDAARGFVTGYFASEAAALDAAPSTRIFDAALTEDASRDMSSVHYGHRLPEKPGAFVYSEVQVGVPFAGFPWPDRNAVLKTVPGLMSKTWLSGAGTQSLGGIDAFDSVENAKAFALESFPKTAAKLGAAYTVRIFDAAVVEDASRDMRSPFFQ